MGVNREEKNKKNIERKNLSNHLNNIYELVDKESADSTTLIDEYEELKRLLKSYDFNNNMWEWACYAKLLLILRRIVQLKKIIRDIQESRLYEGL